jgi:hypothetical protein
MIPSDATRGPQQSANFGIPSVDVQDPSPADDAACARSMSLVNERTLSCAETPREQTYALDQSMPKLNTEPQQLDNQARRQAKQAMAAYASLSRSVQSALLAQSYDTAPAPSYTSADESVPSAHDGYFSSPIRSHPPGYVYTRELTQLENDTPVMTPTSITEPDFTMLDAASEMLTEHLGQLTNLTLMRPISALQRSAPGTRRPSLFRNQTMPVDASVDPVQHCPNSFTKTDACGRAPARTPRRRPTITPLAETMSRSCSSQGHSPYPHTPIRRSSSTARLTAIGCGAHAYMNASSMPPTPTSPYIYAGADSDKAQLRSNALPVRHTSMAYPTPASFSYRSVSSPRLPLSPLDLSTLNSMAQREPLASLEHATFAFDDDEPFHAQFMTAEDAYLV